MLFVLASGRRKEAALCLIAGLTLSSFLVPELRSFTYILIGVLVAVWPAARMRFARIGEASIWGALALLILSPLFARLSVVKEIVQLAQPLLVATVLFGTVFGPEGGKLRAVIQHPILVKTGLVSYSLYLWQQLSLAPVQWADQSTGAAVLYHGFGALLIVAFAPLAIASYFFLERPLVATGHRISRRIIERDSMATAPEPGGMIGDQHELPGKA
jgi:peptidoglycan/LPS O-acetylase OafA/YrhL